MHITSMYAPTLTAFVSTYVHALYMYGTVEEDCALTNADGHWHRVTKAGDRRGGVGAWVLAQILSGAHFSV